MSRADRFLRACRREPVDCTPVWMMRQAGRYMAEYRALREKHTMLEVCKTPELALAVTLQPLKFGMDAAILFADILLPLEPMGAPFELAEVVRKFLHKQIDAGVDAVQLFDSWVGQLSAEDYRTYVQKHVSYILKDIEKRGVPVIHFGTGTYHLLEAQREAGGTVIGLDW